MDSDQLLLTGGAMLFIFRGKPLLALLWLQLCSQAVPVDYRPFLIMVMFLVDIYIGFKKEV